MDDDHCDHLRPLPPFPSWMMTISQPLTPLSHTRSDLDESGHDRGLRSGVATVHHPDVQMPSKSVPGRFRPRCDFRNRGDADIARRGGVNPKPAMMEQPGVTPWSISPINSRLTIPSISSGSSFPLTSELLRGLQLGHEKSSPAETVCGGESSLPNFDCSVPAPTPSG
jgi:hypothetical protein